MLMYGKYACFVMQFVNAGQGCKSRSHDCLIGSHECVPLFTLFSPLQVPHHLFHHLTGSREVQRILPHHHHPPPLDPLHPKKGDFLDLFLPLFSDRNSHE